MIVYELHWYHENDEEYGNYVMGIYSSREKAWEAAPVILEKVPQLDVEGHYFEVYKHQVDRGMESV